MAASTDGLLLVLSNPLLDILAVGNNALLSRYNLKSNDATLASDQHAPLFDELIQSFKAQVIAGGGSNIARGAQYVLPPSSTLFVGCVGDDIYAKMLKDSCTSEGVDTDFRVDEKLSTGRCGVIITGHNRSLCTSLGAANACMLDHLRTPSVWEKVRRSKIFYVEGYHLTACVPAALALAEEAAEKKKTFVFSFSAPFIVTGFQDDVAEILEYADYVIGNESEALAWAETQGHQSKSIHDIAKLLVQLPIKKFGGKRIVIITQGKDSTISAVVSRSEVVVTEYAVHAIPGDSIRDTNGAGDAWAGGFVAGLWQDKSLAECIEMGHWLARLGIQELGAAYPYPKQTYKSSMS